MKKEKQLFERINELMGDFEYSNLPDKLLFNKKEGKIKYSSNDDIRWAEIFNQKTRQLLSEINDNLQWTKIMYTKYIPEEIINDCFDYMDWMNYLEYGHPSDLILDRHSNIFDNFLWQLISTNEHSAEFIDKYFEHFDAECIPIYNRYLPEWFIIKYIDKLNWSDIISFQKNIFLNVVIEFMKKHNNKEKEDLN